MSLGMDALGSFGDLATAIGLMRDGSPNTNWFADPIGEVGNGPASFEPGLRTVLADDAQRDALTAFVDEVLGPPDRDTHDDEVWVPLFDESDPNVTIHAVLTPRPGSVRLGIGLEYESGPGTPRVRTTAHVPIFQMERRGGGLEAGAPTTPDWLLLGGPNGTISLSVSVVLDESTPPAGDASLGGVELELSLPTSGDGDLAFALRLERLQLPGAEAPQDFVLDVDALDEIGAETLDLVLGLLRAQADALDPSDPAVRPFASLMGVVGIRSVPGVPPFPLADLATSGVDAVVTWVSGVLADATARAAWLGELAELLGGTADPADDAVSFGLGPADVQIGVRLETGVNGLPVLVPWVEVGADTGGGSRGRVEAGVDVLRLDTGTGEITSVPRLRAEAVLGVDAGGPPLLTGDPGVGSLRVGISVVAGVPAFTFVLADAVVNGRPHALVDLSSPDAAVDAAESIVRDAVVAALAGLGPPGDLLAAVLGVQPPTGIDAVDVVALLADPLGELAEYWNALVGSSDAMRAVLAQVQELLTGTPVTSIPGSGVAFDPWIVALGASVALRVAHDAGELTIGVGVSSLTPVLDDHEVTTSIIADLARIRLAESSADFVTGASGSLRLARVDDTPISLDVGDVSVQTDHVAIAVRWVAGGGFVLDLEAPGAVVRTAATVDVPAIDVALPIPRFEPDGTVTFTPTDWTDVERAIAALLGTFENRVIAALVDLVGWTSEGPRLSLGDLIARPETAISTWLADLVLDCDRVRAALEPIASILSGFRGELLGVGTPELPFRCPVGGAPGAPGPVVWLEPGCSPPPDPVGFDTERLRAPEPLSVDDVVSVIATAGGVLAPIGDLVAHRRSLGEGLELLRDRWDGSDGLVVPPANLPTGVERVVIEDATYHELVALGSVGGLTVDVFDPLPTAVVHVGCEAIWSLDRAPGTGFDLTVGSDDTIPAIGDGEWFVRLPDPATAAADRPDRGGVGEQAARLMALLADRTDPVSVVAYGAAAAAVLRATNDLDPIERVATVGAPWGAVSVGSLATGLGGDALRLLDLLRVTLDDGASVTFDLEGDPGHRLGRIVGRCEAALVESGRPPSAATETPRDAVEVVAVFGTVDSDEIEVAIAHAVADGLDRRLEAVTSFERGPVTAVHGGVGLPSIDVDVSGFVVGVSGAVTVVTARRGDDDALEIERGRQLVLDISVGVRDGWLVGGPGADQHELELRSMSARVEMPLDGGTGHTTLTLHEATAFGISRERWVVGPDDVIADADAAASTVVPELRALVSQVIRRIDAEAADLAAALAALGLIVDGGLDPAALDRWVLDTTRASRDALAADVNLVAGAIRTLIGDATSTGASLAWSGGDHDVSVDLATGAIDAAASSGPGMAAWTMSLGATPAGADLTATLGEIDEHRGGLRLVAAAGSSGPASLAIEVASAGSLPETIELYPRADATGIVRLGATSVSAGLGLRVVDHLRATVSATRAAALDEALALVGVLGEATPEGVRNTLVPFGLFLDPAAWVRSGVDRWRANFGLAAVELLEVIGELVAPGAAGSWQISAEFAVAFSATSSGRLRLGVAYLDDIASGPATTSIALDGGVVVGVTGGAEVFADATVAVDGHGARLTIDRAVRLDLVRPVPRPAVTLYPSGSGIGDIAAAAGGMIAPIVLNALIDHRDDPGSSVLIDAARVAYDLAGALDLLESDTVTEARLLAFAADPAAALAARLPHVAAGGVARLAVALDPGGSLVVASQPASGQTRLELGASGGVGVLLDGTGPDPAVELSVGVDLGAAGRLVVDGLRVSAAGVSVAARVGPASISAGPVALFPLVVVRAGLGPEGFTRTVGVGLSTDIGADTSVEFRWGLDGQPPKLQLITRSGTPGDPDLDVVAGRVIDDPAAAGLQLLGTVVSLASAMLLDELDGVMSNDTRARLQGVVFTDAPSSTTVDPAVFEDLLDPDALLDRLLRLAWNLAEVSPPSITIDNTLTIGLVSLSDGSPSNRRLGLNVALTPNSSYTIATGTTQVDLVVDAAWIDGDVDPGLTIELLAGTLGDLEFAPAVAVGGLGLRVSKTGGPVLDLGGVAIDAIGVHLYAEATSSGQVGGGVEIQLDGFAFSPAAGGGENQVANSLMNEAGEAGAADRPAISPALSVQQQPGSTSASVGFRAGDLPGPWWVVVQRQLGPIYIEQVGLDTVESGGRVTRISLLFDGRVSLFGLDAAVDQLSLNWNGGDVLSVRSWSVDLMGLAISADLSGAYLSGGLLKTTQDGQISYVGMLLGRFGVYGLSVFGGYTDDDGSPSFFVFGAVNGPIGGPPAFFLTGIGGGLGINRGLRTPSDFSRFDEYPFIKALDPASGPSDDPMAELRDLNAYFPAESGNFWFAAGISFTSFALIDGIAVVSVSFGTGLEINVFGLARLALPRPEVALVSIELGLLVRFSTTDGLFLMQAQLTDNSWLLYEEVRLTGGFAMAMWWKGELAGQFVVSLGGYHPDFHRPGYPVVPRLGLEWRISDEIVVKGGSYFALTSEAVMAGVDVEVSANWGWAWVRVAFGAHAIVYFDPFYYQAMAYARISAGIRIKIWFATVSFSISIGARIEVEGPDFSGRATFEIGPCELSVSFGNSRKENTPVLEWSEFVPKYLEDAGGGRARALSGITGVGTRPAATGGDTSSPSSDGSEAHPYEVFAEFEISFVSSVPVTRFQVGSHRHDVTPTLSDNTTGTLGIAPMGVESATSALTISVEKLNPATDEYESIPAADVDALANGLQTATTDLSSPHVRTDSFPIGVWGPAEDPDDKPLPQGDVVRAGNMIKLVAGFSSATAGPPIDYRQVTADRRPLPLLVAANRRVSLLATAGAVTVVNPTSARAALDAAEAMLFSSNEAAPVSGLLARGDHGAVAAASFRGDRAAPPRFGTLAGGIRAQTGDRAVTERLAAPLPAEGRRPRPPTVVGMLSAGAGVMTGGARTTVADRRIKRRPAPSVDSVRGRLGSELPLKLERPAAPAQVADDTLVVTSYPRTDLAGAAKSYTGGRLGSPHLDALVGGLRGGAVGPEAESADSPIRSGDLVVLERPDAAIDVDESSRPALRVDGAARVLMVRGAGTVVTDVEIVDGAVEVPPRVRLVAVQADGELDVTDGLPGWHARSRLGRLGVGTAIGPGCSVTSDAPRPRRRTGWVSGFDLVERANIVTTHFARRASFVALVLDGEAAVEALPMGVRFRGARRSTDGSGNEIAPTVVLAGSQSIVVVPIDVDAEAFDVVVHAGGEWRLAGVLAGTVELEATAELLAERGVDAVAARLLAVAGPGCSVVWSDPPSRSGRRPAKKSGAKKSGAKRPPAKKSGAKKSGAKKSAAKKSAAKKPPVKKSSAKKSGAKRPPAKKSGAKKSAAKRGGAG